MRRIVVSTFATLDGVVDAPAEETYLRFHDDEVMADTVELLRSCDALLLGRKTYQGLAAAWKPQTGDVADRLNAMRKYVVSTTLERADEWANSTLIAGDAPAEIARLKRQPGKDIVSYGCGRLARTLVEYDLVDEIQISVVPLVVGRGTHLFDDPEETIELWPTGTRAFAAGTTLLSFATRAP
jgi:dihydrofolate reductase